MSAAPLPTLAEAGPKIAAGELSPVALTEAALARAAALQPKLDAFIEITADRARAAAKRAEKAIAGGRRRGPLHGIPYGLKDIYDAAGLRTTAHSRLRLDNIAATDAVTTARLEAAGMILTGKLDAKTADSAWVRAIERAGVWVRVWPVGRGALPAWLESRAKMLELRLAPGVAQAIADRVEGNLLAAKQELDMLALLANGAAIDADLAMRDERSPLFGASNAGVVARNGRLHRRDDDALSEAYADILTRAGLADRRALFCLIAHESSSSGGR